MSQLIKRVKKRDKVKNRDQQKHQFESASPVCYASSNEIREVYKDKSPKGKKEQQK